MPIFEDPWRDNRHLRRKRTDSPESPVIPKAPWEIKSEQMISEISKPFDLFTDEELEEFKRAITENRVSSELRRKYYQWEQEEAEQRRRDANPPGPGWGRH